MEIRAGDPDEKKIGFLRCEQADQTIGFFYMPITVNSVTYNPSSGVLHMFPKVDNIQGPDKPPEKITVIGDEAASLLKLLESVWSWSIQGEMGV